MLSHTDIHVLNGVMSATKNTPRPMASDRVAAKVHWTGRWKRVASVVPRGKSLDWKGEEGSLCSAYR